GQVVANSGPVAFDETMVVCCPNGGARVQGDVDVAQTRSLPGRRPGGAGRGDDEAAGVNMVVPPQRHRVCLQAAVPGCRGGGAGVGVGIDAEDVEVESGTCRADLPPAGSCEKVEYVGFFHAGDPIAPV